MWRATPATAPLCRLCVLECRPTLGRSCRRSWRASRRLCFTSMRCHGTWAVLATLYAFRGVKAANVLPSLEQIVSRLVIPPEPVHVRPREGNRARTSSVVCRPSPGTSPLQAHAGCRARLVVGPPPCSSQRYGVFRGPSHAQAQDISGGLRGGGRSGSFTMGLCWATNLGERFGMLMQECRPASLSGTLS